MKTVALIPIKLGSKRVPGKNIKPFYDGTPLMCAFDALTRSYADTSTDGSFYWTPDPDEFEVFNQDYFRDPADVIRLNMK